MCTSAPARSVPRLAAVCGGALLAGVFGGCAVGPDYVRPPAPPVTHYAGGADPQVTVAAQGTAQRFATASQLTADWWHVFRSAKLDAVVAEALAGNPGLEAAQASLRASEDSLRSGYGIFLPHVDADARATRERFAPASLGQKASGSVFNLFTLSASASYALDVFGGERRMIESLGAQRDLQRASERATYVTLVANVVNTVVAAAAYRAQLEATRQLVDLEREQVSLADVRAQAGTAPYANVLALRGELATSQGEIPQLEQKLAQSEDLLATLVGRVPAQWQVPDIALADLTLPGDLPLSLPSQLVAQRPDVLMAEAAAHAASANVGVATAALLPSLTLNGSYGANGLNTGSILAAGGRAWSVAGDLSAPLFQGGTLWFRRRAAVEDYHQAAALYRQTVLGAFAQVADTLRALEHDAAALQAEDAALEAAQQALQLVQANYASGVAGYLDVLNADTQYHLARISDLQGVAARFQDTVALYVALGGGWWNPP